MCGILIFAFSMPREYQGELSGEGLTVGIVVSRWNGDITESLLRGALRALIAVGTESGNITVVRVPGAFEIPLALETLVHRARPDLLIALGCVIRGETTHFEHVSNAAMEGMRQVSLQHRIPVGCGVLTTETSDQAWERAGDNEENKGSESALAAVEMANLMRQLSGSTVS